MDDHRSLPRAARSPAGEAVWGSTLRRKLKRAAADAHRAAETGPAL